MVGYRELKCLQVRGELAGQPEDSKVHIDAYDK